MCKEKKEMNKEEKIDKAKELMKEINELELSEEELKGMAGGIAVCDVCVRSSSQEGV